MTLAEDLYEAARPLAAQDEQLGWPLRTYVEALATTLQFIEELVRDTDDGPGWSALLDVDAAPAEALGWLAQFVGVRLRGGSSLAEQRLRIRETDGFRRGSVGAIAGAARQHLTGTKTAEVRERDGGAYRITVITYTAETPDSGAVLAALREQIPAGLVLTYEVLPGWTLAQMEAAPLDDLADLETTFSSVGHLETNVPA